MQKSLKQKRKLRSSKRGLTFSIRPDEQYYPGSHYIYEVRKNCIVIRPSEEGSTVSRKKSGSQEKALFDIRQKDVRRAVSSCDYLEVEIKENRIVVRCIREVHNKVVRIEEVLNELCVPYNYLHMAAGMEGQISFSQYLETLGEQGNYFEADEKLQNDIPQIFSVMSLFSGAGMLDWPFHKDPAFEFKFACDYDKGACESYRHNIGNHIFCGDIRDIRGDADPYNVIIGGPSCKPFSASNRRRMVDEHQDVDLVNEYIRIARENRPEIFVIENVPQFISCNNGMYMERILNGLGDEYEITATILKDSDVGGYTLRKRAILIGSRIGKITLPNTILHPVRTVKEALGKVAPEWFNYLDLTKNRPETIRNMSFVRQGHNFKDIPELKDNTTMHSDRYYRLDPDKPSPTIVNWRKLPLIHPTENRTLTVAEASALMGFGKEFQFHGSLDSRQQQCGNGCTFAIGKLIKETVKRTLMSYHAINPTAV